MRQLTFIEPGKLEWHEVPEPQLTDPKQAIVRPVAVATCDLEVRRAQGAAKAWLTRRDERRLAEEQLLWRWIPNVEFAKVGAIEASVARQEAVGLVECVRADQKVRHRPGPRPTGPFDTRPTQLPQPGLSFQILRRIRPANARERAWLWTSRQNRR